MRLGGAVRIGWGVAWEDDGSGTNGSEEGNTEEEGGAGGLGRTNMLACRGFWRSAIVSSRQMCCMEVNVLEVEA